MRLGDLEDAVYDGLRGLPHDVYLRLLYGICEEFRLLFDQEFSSEDRIRVTESLAAAERLLSAPGRGSTDDRIIPMVRRWRAINGNSGGRVSSGVSHAFATFESLLGELCGAVPPYWAAEWVCGAIRFYDEPSTLDPEDPDYQRKFQHIVWLNSPLEVDESEFYVRLFRAMESAVQCASHPGAVPEWGQGDLRMWVFGELS